MTTESEVPDRIPAQPLRGITTATDEQAELIAKHVFWSKHKGCTHRRADVERRLLALSPAREVHTSTHKARWMPVSRGVLAPMSDVVRDLVGQYPKLDNKEDRVLGSPLQSGVKLMVVPR